MSGHKSQNLREFYRRLRARGETLQTLAAAIGLQRHSYVSRLVHGHGRRRDGIWWPRLKARLTPEERTLIDRYNYPTVAAAVAALKGAEPSSSSSFAQEIAEVAEKKTSSAFSAPSCADHQHQHPLGSETASRFLDWKHRKAS